MLYDRKGRRYLIDLIEGASFHYHKGALAHAEIVGTAPGTTLASTLNAPLTVLRPRLADYVTKMGRGAAIVYPKDVGAILTWGDIGSGMTVLEAGTGSGSLTMALARTVGSSGHVVSVDLRQDHHDKAKKLIRGFFNGIPHWIDLIVGDVGEVLANTRPDRVVLDVPEPWHHVPCVVERMRLGGVFCSYLPTIPQVEKLRAAMAGTRRFIEVTSFEVFHREWAVSGRSVRPEHRMVGHTGFITVGRTFRPLTKVSTGSDGDTSG
ncbi:MAG: tRNA (adenine-N1)-methyltransferase [Acidobacteria bacterium]|nr:tRNA (adenine-N1)-methyltransferase [Acidobacteriota bacterium]